MINMRHIFLIGLLALSSTLRSQDVIIPFRHCNKWYFVDEDFNRIGNNNYQDAFPFYNDIAVVKQNEKYGFVNNTDSLIIPYQFDFAKCYYSSLQVSLDGDTFLIDKNGEKTQVLPIDNNNFYVPSLNRIFESNGKFGVVGSVGDTLLFPHYDSISIVNFSEVIMVWNAKRKIGVFNQIGKMVYQFELDYFEINNPSNPEFILIRKKNKLGAIGLKGAILANPKYLNLNIDNHLMYTILKNGKKGYIYNGKEYWRNFLYFW